MFGRILPGPPGGHHDEAAAEVPDEQDNGGSTMKRTPAFTIRILVAVAVAVTSLAAGCLSYTRESHPVAVPAAPTTSSYTTSTTVPAPD